MVIKFKINKYKYRVDIVCNDIQMTKNKGHQVIKKEEAILYTNLIFLSQISHVKK